MYAVFYHLTLALDVIPDFCMRVRSDYFTGQCGHTFISGG